MRTRIAVALTCLLLLTAGCASYPYCDRTRCAWVWIPSAPPPAPPPKNVKLAEPCPPAEPLTPGWWSDAPKSTEPVKPGAAAPGPNGRAQKIASARSDLKVGMTALEVRAVTACTEPGEACVENDALMQRARALDTRLAAAQLDPQLAVNWAEVTTVLRSIVDTAMKGTPK